MQLLQFRGPFAKGERLSVPAKMDCKYVRICVQIYQRGPMFFEADKNVKPDLMINKIKYVIPLTESLQFDGLAELKWDFEFLKDLPPETIIDLVYDISEY